MKENSNLPQFYSFSDEQIMQESKKPNSVFKDYQDIEALMDSPELKKVYNILGLSTNDELKKAQIEEAKKELQATCDKFIKENKLKEKDYNSLIKNYSGKFNVISAISELYIALETKEVTKEMIKGLVTLDQQKITQGNTLKNKLIEIEGKDTERDPIVIKQNGQTYQYRYKNQSPSVEEMQELRKTLKKEHDLTGEQIDYILKMGTQSLLGSGINGPVGFELKMQDIGASNILVYGRSTIPKYIEIDNNKNVKIHVVSENRLSKSENLEKDYQFVVHNLTTDITDLKGSALLLGNATAKPKFSGHIIQMNEIEGVDINKIYDPKYKEHNLEIQLNTVKNINGIAQEPLISRVAYNTYQEIYTQKLDLISDNIKNNIKPYVELTESINKNDKDKIDNCISTIISRTINTENLNKDTLFQASDKVSDILNKDVKNDYDKNLTKLEMRKAFVDCAKAKGQIGATEAFASTIKIRVSMLMNKIGKLFSSKDKDAKVQNLNLSAVTRKIESEARGR